MLKKRIAGGPELDGGRNMGIRETAMIMKQEAPLMAFRSGEEKNNALRAVAEALRGQKEEIFRANKEDLERAEKEGVPVQIRKRLAMDAKKLEGVCDGIEALISLPDPVGKVSLHRELDKGLVLRRISCPIGVIGVIFEARPDALVQISSLCIKSGNTAILKGGKETASTNSTLYRIIHEAGTGAGLPEHFLELAQTLYYGTYQYPGNGAFGRNLSYLCRQEGGSGDRASGDHGCQDPVSGSLQYSGDRTCRQGDRRYVPAASCRCHETCGCKDPCR